MYCENCGLTLEAGSLFCSSCGARINKISNNNLYNTSKLSIQSKKINIKKSIFLIPLFILITITISWNYFNFIKWVEVPVEGDSYRTFYYERKLFYPQDYIQSSKILINMNERSNLNEASYILEKDIDCLTNNSKLHKSTSYFKKYGEGDILHTKNKFGYLGPGIAAVEREICKLGLTDITAQSNRPVSIEELNFNFPTFLSCQEKASIENRQKLIKYVNPFKKMDGYWIYETTGSVTDYFGNYAHLPVKQLWVGVCDNQGSLACGQASFKAIVINMSVKDVKNNLLTHRRLGLDFTIENRDIESGVTKTAHLIENPNNKNSSIIYCDSGNL